MSLYVVIIFDNKMNYLNVLLEFDGIHKHSKLDRLLNTSSKVPSCCAHSLKVSGPRTYVILFGLNIFFCNSDTLRSDVLNR